MANPAGGAGPSTAARKGADIDIQTTTGAVVLITGIGLPAGILLGPRLWLAAGLGKPAPVARLRTRRIATRDRRHRRRRATFDGTERRSSHDRRMRTERRA